MRMFFFILAITLVAVWVQALLPGMGALVPGFVLLLQYSRFHPLIWTVLAWTLLQEGAGSLAFGGMFLVCAGIWAVFLAGNNLFEKDNIFFVGGVLFFAVLWKEVVLWIMTGLQDISLSCGLFSSLNLLQQMAVYFFLYILYSAGFSRFVLGK